jgi:flagellar basal-body rod protein FlgC
MAVAASALRAQQARMRIIAENIANADSTARTPGGDPYRRNMPIFEPQDVEGGGRGVRMVRSAADPSAFRSTYTPGHPAANAQGYVNLPNVDPLMEALDMRQAQRAYEANLSVIDNARAMDMRTLDLLRR